MMSDVTFIFPESPYLMKKTPFPPLGIGYIAAVLKERGYSTELIDGLLLGPSYRKALNHINSDIIGVSASIVQLAELKRLCKQLKAEYPECTVVVGGPGVKCIETQRAFHEFDADIFVAGEGEEIFTALVESMTNGGKYDSICGLYYKTDGSINYSGPPAPVKNLDTLPFPDRELINVLEYQTIWKDNIGYSCTDLISSRGCPFSCIFCDKAFFGSKIRYHSGEYVVDEMEAIIKKYKPDELYFVDDLFLINRKRTSTICRKIKERNLDITWGAQGRVNLIDEDLVKTVYDVGCREINFGIESGSERIIKYLKKGISVTDVERAFEICHKYDISSGAYFIIGVPGETREDIEQTKKLIKKIRPAFISISFLTPYPGTKLYEMLHDMIKDVDYSEWDDLQKSILMYDFEVDPMESYEEIMQYFIDEVNPSRRDFNIYFNKDNPKEGLA